MRGGSAAISPTAYYTGHVWERHGLGVDHLAPPAGRALYVLGQPLLGTVERLGGPTLEHVLLARHRIIDRLLDHELSTGRVAQVVELAAGMTPRGLRVRDQHPGTTYVEVDLPAMAERKRRALAARGALSVRHRVEAVDVFGTEFEALFASLDPEQGVAVVSEGLLNYFPTERVEVLWTRLARVLDGFPSGLYLSDLHLGGDAGLLDRTFAAGLGLFVRGRVHFHYESAAQAEDVLRRSGFSSATLHRPAEYADVLPGMTAAGADRVRVLEARVERT
jgi:O-methyltransferase involved in polyketide biosynthesis